MLTITEAAKLANVTPRTIYNWIKAGRITYPPTVEAIKREVETRLLISQAAERAGVSRRSIYRWRDEGRDMSAPRPRGPKRNPKSRRYLYGRHSFHRKPADDYGPAGEGE